MKKYITPERYESLVEAGQDWYRPAYKKYHVKKVREYQSCDLGHTHFMGWAEEKTPIGEPYRYELVSVFDHNFNCIFRLTRQSTIDSLLAPNYLTQRIFK